MTSLRVKKQGPLHIETSGGTLISLTASMVAATQPTVTIEIYGERGSGFYCDLPRPSVKFLGVKAHKQNPPVWGVHALQRSLAGFAEWIQDDKPYLTPAQEALPVLAAIDGVYRSAEGGQGADIDHL